MSSLPPAVNPPIRALLGPGPSDPHPRVLEALARKTVGHLDPYYLQIMSEVQVMLRQAFQTKNDMTFAVSGTGTAGMEACIVNLVEPGDSILVCVLGVFGGRMAEIARRAGAEVTVIERPWGEVFTPDDLKPHLAKGPKVVAIVHAETSTGAWQPLEEIAGLVHDCGAFLLVDAVTSLGGVPVEVDRWKIDAIFSGSQKCLGGPPGLSPVSFSARAVEHVVKRKTKVQSWYYDVSLLASYWGENRVYHHTGPINMSYALHEGLRILLEEGLTASFERHVRNHKALRAGLEALGLEYATDTNHILPQLSAVKIPAGIEDLKVRGELLKRFNIEIGAGLGVFKGKVWRIGLMGYGSRPQNVMYVLSALEQLLAAQGHHFAPGAGISAANAVYTAQYQSQQQHQS